MKKIQFENVEQANRQGREPPRKHQGSGTGHEPDLTEFHPELLANLRETAVDRLLVQPVAGFEAVPVNRYRELKASGVF